MNIGSDTSNKKSSLIILYFSVFLLSLRFAIPTYVTSSFLSQYVGEKSVGYIYVFGSILTLIVYYLVSKILKKIGNRKTTLYFTALSFISLIALVFSENIYSIAIFLNIGSTAASVVSLCLDIFVEHDSKNNAIGNIRGIYLTILNTAWLVSPFIAGVLVGENNYKNVFWVSSIFLLILFFIVFLFLKDFQDPVYKDFSLIKTLKELIKRRDVRHIIFAFFLLQFFYTWMVIYMPIYLHFHVGLDWITIGKIFTIMLLPFVLIQAPLGKLADGRGEKKTLMAGFFIMAISTFAIPFMHSNSFWVWAIILFVTRIGAAMVEVMSDTYFFKKIGEKDANLISFYRSMIPFAYIAGPISASIILRNFEIISLFYILSFMMLLGIKYGREIKDIK